jgi:hypothetical protein
MHQLPVQVLVQRHPEKGVEHDRAFEQISWPRWSQVQNLPVSVEIDVRCWDLVDRFHRTETTLKLSSLQFHSGGKETKINSLALFPLRFAEDNVKTMLEQRGRMFWGFRQRKYVAYTGPPADSNELIVSACQLIYVHGFLTDVLMIGRQIYDRRFYASKIAPIPKSS